jgi:hypothetical protein
VLVDPRRSIDAAARSLKKAFVLPVPSGAGAGKRVCTALHVIDRCPGVRSEPDPMTVALLLSSSLPTLELAWVRQLLNLVPFSLI